MYLGGQFLAARHDANSSVADELLEEAGDATRPYPVLFGLLVMGCVGLFFGSEAFVFGASEIALDWGVSTHVIGVTVVAFGTSIPEIAASLTAAVKGNSALSIGNLVGSNILNILLVLGATAEVGTLEVSEFVPVHDMWWMFAAAVLLAPLMVLGKGKIGRLSGALYVSIYIVYVTLVVAHG